MGYGRVPAQPSNTGLGCSRKWLVPQTDNPAASGVPIVLGLCWWGTVPAVRQGAAVTWGQLLVGPAGQQRRASRQLPAAAAGGEAVRGRPA